MISHNQKIDITGGGMEWISNEELLIKAKEEAAICLEKNETEREITFGNKKGVVFVTTKPQSVVPIEHFTIKGKDFYLGIKKG